VAIFIAEYCILPNHFVANAVCPFRHFTNFQSLSHF